MTKKERQAYDTAILRAETLAALRWTSDMSRDVLPPESAYSAEEYLKGWDINSYTMSVRAAWTGSVHHGDGHSIENMRHGHGSQGSKRLYSTRLRALQALRYALTMQAAQQLLAIDKEIAKEETQHDLGACYQLRRG